MTIVKSGIVPTKMAAIAVPMRGVANDMPTSWPATVVAPTTANGAGRRGSRAAGLVAAASADQDRAGDQRANVTAPIQAEHLHDTQERD